MPKNILEGRSRHLAGQVENAKDLEKRAIALAVCELVVEKTIPQDPIVRSALQALERSSYGERQIIAALDDHVGELDQKYFAAQKEYWAKRTPEKIYRELFAKARAANAVLYAFNADPFIAVTWAIHEAIAVLGVESVEAEVNHVIGLTSAKHS